MAIASLLFFLFFFFCFVFLSQRANAFRNVTISFTNATIRNLPHTKFQLVICRMQQITSRNFLKYEAGIFSNLSQCCFNQSLRNIRNYQSLRNMEFNIATKWRKVYGTFDTKRCSKHQHTILRYLSCKHWVCTWLSLTFLWLSRMLLGVHSHL